MMNQDHTEPNPNRRLASKFVQVVVLEAAIIVLLIILGRLFS